MKFPRSSPSFISGLAAIGILPARADFCLYTFSGVVSHLEIATSSGAGENPGLNIVPGETRVAYEFELDFDRDARVFGFHWG